MSMESWSTKPRRRKPPDVFTHLLTRPPTKVADFRQGTFSPLLKSRHAQAVNIEVKGRIGRRYLRFRHKPPCQAKKAKTPE